MIAQTIAHYRIQVKIGAGGMGEVYRATDTRLGRDVAIKVLPEALARDVERMARFEREAKLLASVNHPNIASIYGLEESNGIRALVMELVEGVTLAERIKREPLPLVEALPIGKQIAEALEYAHERGIIHRDLKPSNVMLRRDGQVKVLDFGMAKALEGETSEEETENSPTLSAMATRAGVLLGTAAYMSPEQAQGKRVDRRADIWAFGCVLYEMLTCREAFGGETTSDILAGVIRAEPDWSCIPASTPPRIRELLRRCLQKDPKRRLRDIGEARISIEEVLSGASQEASGFYAGAVSPATWRRAAPWATGILLAAVVGVAVWELRPRPPAPEVVQFSFGPPAGDSLDFRGGATTLAISRDGAETAFIGMHGGTSQLYIRRMDRPEVTPLKGTDNGFFPFFSPDGQWVGFFGDGKLKKVSILGGTPVTVGDALAPRGATWTADDAIIFAPGNDTGLMRVSAGGGTPQPFTKLDSSKNETTHRWPQALPGGKAVVYASSGTPNGFDNYAIAVANLKSDEVKILPLRGAYPRYIPGYMVFQRLEGLFAAPFDLQTLKTMGSPFPVLQVLAMQEIGAAAFDVSETGSLVYIPAGAITGKLAWVDRRGVLESLGAPTRDYIGARLSPDGKRIVVIIPEGGMRHLWVYDIVRGSLTRLTYGDSDNVGPTWSPDGLRIAFLSRKEGTWTTVMKSADGSGREEVLMSMERFHGAPSSWSPDGKFLAGTRRGENGRWQTWVLPLGGEPKPQILLANQFDNAWSQFSPDGKYLAYLSNESGRNEVYVIPFGNGSGKWQISTGGSNGSVWGRDGKQLFYRESGNIMGVDIAIQPTFHASTPRVIVPAKALPNLPSGLGGFDVSPDGQRFLIHQQSSEAGQNAQINVVLNWNEELRRLSASGKN
jgi:serine/threonine-protein kinase